MVVMMMMMLNKCGKKSHVNVIQVIIRQQQKDTATKKLSFAGNTHQKPVVKRQ